MTALPLVGFLALSSALFVVGVFGILTRRNFILLLIAIEIAMNAAILTSSTSLPSRAARAGSRAKRLPSY